MIFNIPVEEYIDRLIKQAEYIYGRNVLVSKLLDKAFEKLGSYADGFYAFQDQSLAMMRMLKSWYAREYTGLSKNAVVGLIASAIYIANPLDLIPDFIPLIGKLDDRLVIGYFVKQLNVEIQRFMAWEVEQGLV
jgi:uncharacterized membrane protein YkvA (DUF1232 family)